MSTTLSRPRLLQRVWRRAARGGRGGDRKRRYVVTALGAILAVWAMAAAYYVLSPRTYTSSFTLVLPGPGAASSMNLDSVGSASSTTTSVFSSADMSPTENYRKMLTSHLLQTMAAEVAVEPPESFPLPRIDLVDQTKLITIAIQGRTAMLAVTRARAVRAAFFAMLDQLRTDEIQQRDNTFQTILSGYKQTLQEARQHLIDHEARTGLVSLEQYGSMVASLERLREQQRDIASRLQQARATSAELTRLLGTTPELAANAMVLRADPLFQTLLDTTAKQDAEIATLSAIRGQANPRLQDAVAERASVLGRLIDRGAELTGLKRADVVKLRDLSLRDERARLFERLVSASADERALVAAQHELTAQEASEQERLIRLADEASRLESLRRDVQVAEAVFTSALARIDTSKSDFFASYPMVQTLEAPLTPDRPSSPQLSLAAGGAIGATFLVFAAMVLLWLRLALLQKILKNA